MSKKKLSRFEENKRFPNLIQLSYPEVKNGITLKGKWKTDFFKNDYPIILELACGKGEYTLELAKKNPENNYIGVDIKGARIWSGCKISNEENLKNICFIRSRIELLEHYFDTDEISEIWITFPDPQPKEFKSHKRLTSIRFLKQYNKFLKKKGVIHLKTDNTQLFNYTIEIIKEFGHSLLFQERNIYESNCQGPPVQIQTFYEKKYLKMGLPIHYLKFSLNGKGTGIF